MKPFRFGLQTSSAPDAATWRERARRAEALGYSQVHLSLFVKVLAEWSRAERDLARLGYGGDS